MRSTLLVPLAGLALALAAGPGFSQKVEKEDVSFETFDGVILKGSYYPASKSNAPVVMLMHKWGSDRSKGDWDGLANHLATQGYNVLSFDFRGHGASTSVKPEKFWRIGMNSSHIRGAKPDQKTISVKNFSKNYLPWLVNDIAAARLDLDNRNDSNQCNTSNIIVIAAEEAGPIAMTWMAYETARQANYKMTNVYLDPNVVNPAPGSDDIAGAIWLSFTKTPQGNTFPYYNLIKLGYDPMTRTSPLRDRIPMWFAVGQTDQLGVTDTNYMYDTVLQAEKKKNALELTFKKPIANIKLRGADLLGNGTTNEDIDKYIKKLVEKRPAAAQKKRNAGDATLLPVPLGRLGFQGF